MDKRIVYFILGVLSFGFRLFLEFQTSIIAGINGGYYPVQIRSILEQGHLAMNDMPLIFYVNALFVKLLALIFPLQSAEYLIILGIKILGALSIPLLAIPIYKILNNYFEYKFSWLFEYAIVLFSLFSFSPLYLGADMMKNAYALVWFTYFLFVFLKFFKYKSLKYALLTLLTLIFIVFTHFGVFAISLIFIVIYLITTYKIRAIVPILIITALGFIVVWRLDPFRAFNAINIFEEWFGLPWRIAFYPAGIASFILSVMVGLILFLTIRNQKLENKQKYLFTIFLWFITLLSLPLLRFELWRRFNLMLFIPQLVALMLVYPYLVESYKKKFIGVLNIIVGLSIIYSLFLPKVSSIDLRSYDDLAEISSKISNPDKTIIVARHGLDWWVVWQLKTKIAQSHVKIDESITSKYDEILILRQKRGHNDLYPGPGSPFYNPSLRENNILLYTSTYFDLYKWSQ